MNFLVIVLACLVAYLISLLVEAYTNQIIHVKKNHVPFDQYADLVERCEGLKAENTDLKEIVDELRKRPSLDNPFRLGK